jgi:hypothetical protein
VQEFLSLTHKGIRNKVGDTFGREGEKIFDSAVVSITSDVAANFVLWAFGFGPAYYGLKCAGFTFFSATFKYYIKGKINEHFYNNYYLKHLTAGAVGGGSYYGFNYLFKVKMDENIAFNCKDLINKAVHGIINNAIWEFSSETLKTIKKQDEWGKYTNTIFFIEAVDCINWDRTINIKCLKKQPLGAVSRGIGAYTREKLFSNSIHKKSEEGSIFYDSQEDLNLEASIDEQLKSVDIDEYQHLDL